MVDAVKQTSNFKPIIALGSAGALVGGIGEAVKQKKVFNHADEFIKEFEGNTKRQQQFCTEFHKGTKEAAQFEFDKLEKQLQDFKNWAKGGKLNFKNIAKKAAGAGAIAALVAGIIYLATTGRKQLVRQDAQILAEELNKKA